MPNEETKTDQESGMDHAVVQVAVTSEDIQKGIGRSCSGCPVSWAIYRLLNRNLYAYVCPYIAFVDDDRVGIFIRDQIGHEHNHRIECPESVTEFAMDFDDWFDWECCGCEEEKSDFRKQRGWEPDETPIEPEPFTFEIAIPNQFLVA